MPHLICTVCLPAQATNSDFTRAWHKHWYGQLGLAVLGIAFTAAFLVQVQNLVTKKIHHELKKDVRSVTNACWCSICLIHTEVVCRIWSRWAAVSSSAANTASRPVL